MSELFGDLPAQRRERPQASARPRVLEAVCLDNPLAPEHPARAVWAFVEGLDLAPLYAGIRASEDRAGRPAIDPKILVSLWLYATVDGVGSARALARLGRVALHGVGSPVLGEVRVLVSRPRRRADEAEYR